MRRALFGLIAVMAATSVVRAQDHAPQQPTFSAGVDLVTVNVVVRTASGQPVTGLTKRNFALLDAGVPVDISEFRSGPGPVTAALVMDASGSMALAPKPAESGDAAEQVLEALQPGVDQAALFSFDTALAEPQPPTTDLGLVRQSLAAVRPFGETSLYDALAGASRALAGDRQMRRALVVITDGLDNTSRLDTDAAADVARQLDVPVYAIEVSDDVVPRSAAGRPVDPLAALTSATGGRVFSGRSSVARRLAGQTIVAELRNEYMLVFPSGTRAGWHPLEVRVDKKDVVVRARSGYTAGARSNGW